MSEKKKERAVVTVLIGAKYVKSDWVGEVTDDEILFAARAILEDYKKMAGVSTETALLYLGMTMGAEFGSNPTMRASESEATAKTEES